MSRKNYANARFGVGMQGFLGLAKERNINYQVKSLKLSSYSLFFVGLFDDFPYRQCNETP
jgi:hypothetical protein